MPTYNVTQIYEILKLNDFFIPPELIIFLLVKNKKAQEVKGGLSPLSERRYKINEEDILDCSKELYQKGYSLWESTRLVGSIPLPKIEDIFERFIQMSNKEIVLLTPFLSTEFVIDLGKKFVSKRNITKLVTNKPESSVALSNQKKTIDSVKKRGIKVLLSKIDIHAKAYVFDGKAAIIGSSNLSRNGFFSFYELGVVIFGEEAITLRDIIDKLAD